MRKILVVFCLLWLFPVGVVASQEFHTNYLVDYKFDASGNSTINQRLTLTNLQTQVYASTYQFTIPGKNPPQIRGRDAKGELKITTEPQEDKTLVSVTFNEPVVGKGNAQHFELSYAGPSATHNGQIWEIVLPGLGDSDFIDEYQLRLSVDPALGKLAFMSPNPVELSNSTYVFDKSQLTKIGVVAAFGNFQTFSFTLKYQLENSQKQQGYTEIAIPADTNYQRVFYDSLTPAPKSVRIDEEGNWLARYELRSLEKLEVTAIGQAHLLAEPVKLFTDQVSGPSLNKYLASTYFWPSSDPQIRQIAQTLKTPEAIYNYVATTLSYDFDEKIGVGRPRKGGKLALTEPDNSVCLEFTDLFITLARAAGIPAREVDGYAYASDANSRPLSLGGDVLHAWPQYWDSEKQMWISVDPTWANTTGGVDYFHKLDFNHFAFVTHGISDTEPLAAGLYKTDQSAKNVDVQFATYKDYPPQNLTMDWHPPWQVLPFKNSNSILTLTNNQGQAKYHVDVHLSAYNFLLASQEQTRVTAIPPYGQVQIPLVLQKGQILNFSPQSFVVRIGRQAMTYNIKSQLYLAWHIGVALIASFIIVGLAAIAGQAGGVYFQISKVGNRLRGKGKGPPA